MLVSAFNFCGGNTAKLREHPKALTTKLRAERLVMARLMASGMVKTSKMDLRFFDSENGQSAAKS